MVHSGNQSKQPQAGRKKNEEQRRDRETEREKETEGELLLHRDCVAQRVNRNNKTTERHQAGERERGSQEREREGERERASGSKRGKSEHEKSYYLIIKSVVKIQRLSLSGLLG